MKFAKLIYIIIGTRAQFIKVAPLMRKMLDQGINYKLIYTAQHQENIKEILDIYHLPDPDILMYQRDEAKSRSSFLVWFISVLFKVIFSSKKYLSNPGFVLTHGDTFTTWIAALMGKLAGCKVCHIESGLRSFNIFSPFPEEISRLITFILSDIYFCPNQIAINNLKGFKGEKVNIKANTMLDGVRFALEYDKRTLYDFQETPYALVSLHRYENIFTARLINTILPILRDIAQDHKLIFVLHPTTRERLKSLNIFDELDFHPNIILHERFDFVNWINICNLAEFVITDGGSNQEELFYLGVPTILFRKHSERSEGININIVLSKFNRNIIEGFLDQYSLYRKDIKLLDLSPSQEIIDYLGSK